MANCLIKIIQIMEKLELDPGVIVDLGKSEEAKKLLRKLEASQKKGASLQKQVISLHKAVLVQKMKRAVLQRKIDDNEEGVIGDYERDLIWMAYRYAIGRHTIHASTMCKDMCMNIPGRVSKARARFMAEDIQKEIAMHLRFLPATFRIDEEAKWDGVPFGTSSEYYRPLDYFIRFVNSRSIRKPEELNKFQYITFIGMSKGSFEFEAGETDGCENFYSWMDWEDLFGWNNLSKLLDARCHRWAIIKDKRYKNKVEMVEYFNTYCRNVGYNTPEDKDKPLYKQVLIPVHMMQRNPYIFCTIDPGSVVVSEIVKEDVEYFKEKYNIKEVYRGT